MTTQCRQLRGLRVLAHRANYYLSNFPSCRITVRQNEFSSVATNVLVDGVCRDVCHGIVDIPVWTGRRHLFVPCIVRRMYFGSVALLYGICSNLLCAVFQDMANRSSTYCQKLLFVPSRRTSERGAEESVSHRLFLLTLYRFSSRLGTSNEF